MSSFPVISTSCLLQHPLTIGTCTFSNTGARVHKPLISSAVIRIFVIITNNSQRSTNFSFKAVSSRSYPYQRHDRLSVEKYNHDSSKDKSYSSAIKIGDKAGGVRV